MTRLYHAPGRANLLGEHTDHTDGLVLPAAIDRGITLRGAPGGGRIRLTSDGFDEVADVAADGSDPPQAGFGRFVAAVANQLAAAGRPAVGITGHLSSDLPRGAGLSSSAALEVVTAIALCDAADHHLEPIELAALCRRAEHLAVGVPSGIMDQAASILGRSGHAILLDCQTLHHRAVPVLDGHVVLVLDTGVQRELETSEYRQRLEELRSALHVLEGRRPAEMSPGDLPRLLSSLDEIPARRLRHVVTENHRVREVVAAFETADHPRVQELFAAGHASLRDDFEVSIPELDTIVELAVDAGATAARMTGAGFGGAAVALVREADAEEVGATVLDGYRRHFPARQGVVHVCRAADGAQRLE